MGEPTPDATLVSEEVLSKGNFTNYQKHLKGLISSGDPELKKEEEAEINRQGVQFFEKGNAGFKLKGQLDKCFKGLTLSKAIRDELKTRSGDQISADDEQGLNVDDSIPADDEELRKLYIDSDDCRHFLSPAFFKSMVTLRKQKRDFAVVFRTFGDDLESTVMEWNRFCEGTHPGFNGKNKTSQVTFNGQKCKDLRISSIGRLQRGCRKNSKEDDIALVVGSRHRIDPFHMLHLDELQTIHKSAGQLNAQILLGQREVYHQLHETIAKGPTNACLIQDDYHWWNSHSRAQTAGKVVFVDSTDQRMLPIIFDDHCEENYKIVDVRDPVDFKAQAVNGQDNHANMNLVRVDPVKSLMDADQFTKKIQECEKNRNAQIEEFERLAEIERNKVIPPPTEWEILQNDKPRDYLQKTVLPLLQLGMKNVDELRPDDPISYLALFMLKNKNLVKNIDPPVINEE